MALIGVMEFFKREDGEVLPVVTLLGRTNVGKSSIFNLLLGENRAITIDQAGSTRDVLRAPLQVNGRNCQLVDTGGVQCDSNDAVAVKVGENSWQSAISSDLILLVLEAGAITGEDEELCQKLRPHAAKVLVLVNKADSAELEMDAWNVLAYGFERVLPFSVHRRRNIGRLLHWMQELLWIDQADAPAEQEVVNPLRLAIVGKPNSGKSTLLNTLVGQEVALVSEVAGTTRDSLYCRGHWLGQDFEIIDTAGIRRKKQVHEDLEYYALQRSFDALGQADVAILLIDATEGLTDQDKKIAGRAIKLHCPLLLVLNKEDLLDSEQLKQVEDELRFCFPILSYAPLFSISAQKIESCRPLLSAALNLYHQAQRQITTSQLNQAVADWQLFQPVPRVGKTVYKIRYLVQQKGAPPYFIIFVNVVKDFPESYRRYLINQLRREFGFTHVPITIELRQRENWEQRQGGEAKTHGETEHQSDIGVEADEEREDAPSLETEEVGESSQEQRPQPREFRNREGRTRDRDRESSGHREPGQFRSPEGGAPRGRRPDDARGGFARREGGSRDAGRGSFERRPPRQFGERSNFARREGGSRDAGRGSFERRAPREFGERSSFPRREGGPRDAGRGSFERRPPREFGERSSFPRREGGPRDAGRGSFERRPPREFGERSSFPRREGGPRDAGRGSFERRPPREFGERSSFPRREGGPRDAGRGSFERRPPREFGERSSFPRREGGPRDAGRGSFERRPPREFGERSSFPRREGGPRDAGRGSFERRPPREFGERSSFPRREGGPRDAGRGSFERRPPREFGERSNFPRREGGSRDAGRGSFDRRPPREFGERSGFARRAPEKANAGFRHAAPRGEQRENDRPRRDDSES